jgi:hypothetical protein
MKQILLLIAVIGIFCSCAGVSSNNENKADRNYEKSKESLEDIEKKSPIKFLSVEGDKKKNLIGQTVVRGDISNHAKIVTYKDVDIKLTFFSKTGAILEEDHETIYENIAPGSSVHFKSKYFTPKGTDSVSFKVVEAKF